MARPRTIDEADILRSAREVFMEQGARGSTREIARRLGVSEATLFKRYPTKVDLFLAAMTPPLPDTEAMLKRARARKDTRRALHLVGTFALDYFRTAIPQMLPLITHPGVGIESLLRAFGESPATSFHVAVAEFLAERRGEGGLATPEPLAAAGLIVSAMHSVALFEVTGLHGGAVPARVVQAMLDALWLGLAPPTPPTPPTPTSTRKRRSA